MVPLGFLFSVGIIILPIVQVTSSGWSYEGHTGPSHWKDTYPDCGKNSQSPIDIKPGSTSYDDALVSFTLNGYDDETLYNLTYTNNGHTVQVDVTEGVSISGGKLPEEFKLAQFHFHWGSEDSKGSEHIIDGSAYPMEMHLVHYGAQYSAIADAVDKPKGLAVLGFFFEVSASDNTALNKFLDHQSIVANKDGTGPIPSFALSSLFPSDLSTYFRYSGSLTTPGCFESVIWTVFKQPIKISNAQLIKFRNLKTTPSGDPSPKLMVNNFRPVQALNSRVVYVSEMSSASSFGKTVPLLLISIAVVFSSHI